MSDKITNNNGSSNPECILIPNKRLKGAIDEVSAVLGPLFHEVVLKNLEESGIDLDGTEAKYSLADIRVKLNLLFGQDVTDLLVDKLRAKLDE
jgi:hypothetical protein